MANREAGDGEINAEGKRYTIRFTMNAICEMEDLFGAPAPDVLAGLANGSYGSIRKIVLAGLTDTHPEISDLNRPQALKTVGRLIESAGGNKTVGQEIGKALRAAFPAAETDTENPLNAAD